MFIHVKHLQKFFLVAYIIQRNDYMVLNAVPFFSSSRLHRISLPRVIDLLTHWFGCYLVSSMFLHFLPSPWIDAQVLIVLQCCAVTSLSVLADSLWLLWSVACQAPLSIQILQARILEWVSYAFVQEIFPTQGLSTGLPHCRWILYHLNQQGKGSFCF